MRRFGAVDLGTQIVDMGNEHATDLADTSLTKLGSVNSQTYEDVETRIEISVTKSLPKVTDSTPIL
jgi:hypothetical protein